MNFIKKHKKRNKPSTHGVYKGETKRQKKKKKNKTKQNKNKNIKKKKKKNKNKNKRNIASKIHHS